MKYLVRSLKYFCALCVICVVLMSLMLLTGTSALTFDQTFAEMFTTDRYLVLFLSIVVLSALYPRFGFVVRSVEGDMERNREQIINAFLSAGFSLREEQMGTMTFRADGIYQKIMLLGEDLITVRQHGEQLQIDGIRRGVARVEYRLDSYIQMAKRNE